MTTTCVSGQFHQELILIMGSDNLARGIFPLTTKKFQVEVPMDFAIVAVQHSHYTNLVVTK